MNQKKVTAYIDGSCIGNPGPGGWGAILYYGEHTKEIYGSELDTTNNRMEIMAAIKVLESLKKTGIDITIFTDSTYLKNGMTKWLEGWKKSNWKPKGRSAIKNQDLWLRLDSLANNFKISWQWVKGHSGDEGNEKADMLARKGSEEAIQDSRL